jgi:hypothetical protein
VDNNGRNRTRPWPNNQGYKLTSETTNDIFLRTDPIIDKSESVNVFLEVTP